MSPVASRAGKPSPRASFGVVLAGFTISVAAPALGHDRLVSWIGVGTALAVTLISGHGQAGGRGGGAAEGQGVGQ